MPMKNLSVIFLILASTCLFAQTRKSILKEIKSSQNKVYSTSSYPTDSMQLANLIKNYFYKDKFHLLKNEHASFFKFTKIGWLACNNQSPTLDWYNYGGTIGSCQVNLYVTINIINNNGAKKITIDAWAEEYNTPLTTYFYQRQTFGMYKYNSAALFKYLYYSFYKTPPKLPMPLLSTIENFNTQQTNENKKLIAGRDY